MPKDIDSKSTGLCTQGLGLPLPAPAVAVPPRLATGGGRSGFRCDVAVYPEAKDVDSKSMGLCPQELMLPRCCSIAPPRHGGGGRRRGFGRAVTVCPSG